MAPRLRLASSPNLKANAHKEGRWKPKTGKTQFSPNCK